MWHKEVFEWKPYIRTIVYFSINILGSFKTLIMICISTIAKKINHQRFNFFPIMTFFQYWHLPWLWHCQLWRRVRSVNREYLLLLGTWSYLYLFGGLCSSYQCRSRRILFIPRARIRRISRARVNEIPE